MATYTKFQCFVEDLAEVNSIPSPVDDGAIWIHDPWDNLTIRLRDRYKKPIQQFSSYRRQA